MQKLGCCVRLDPENTTNVAHKKATEWPGFSLAVFMYILEYRNRKKGDGYVRGRKKSSNLQKVFF